MNWLGKLLAIFGMKPKPKLDHDDWPAGYERQCRDAESRAVAWYSRKYGGIPKIPFTRVIITGEPQNGMGGWTTGQTIHIWEGQRPFDASLEHEFRHVLCLKNGKGSSEEAVQ